MRAIAIISTILLASSLSGCGAVRATSALAQANQKFEQVTAAGAAEKAPYEYTLGKEFLNKAREEIGYSDYQVAERLAKQANGIFAHAARIALDDEQSGANEPSQSEE